MRAILGLDLGKYKSVAYLYDTAAARFGTVFTDPDALLGFLVNKSPVPPRSCLARRQTVGMPAAAPARSDGSANDFRS